jgi:hypothetical protein
MLAVIIKEAIISGAHILLVFLVLLFVYFLWKLISLLGDWLIWQRQQARMEAKILVKSLFNFIIFFLISLSVLVFAIGWVNTSANKTNLVQNNDYLMSLDKAIFGVHVPFWLQDINNPLKSIFDFLSPWFINTYQGLSVVLGIVFIIALISNQKRFYQMFLSLILCGLLSLPFWYYYPSLTPKEAYWASSSFQESAPLNAKEVLIQYQPTYSLLKFLGPQSIDKGSISLNSYTITTIPSMHVAWATIALYFAVEISWWLLLLLGPYFILNFLATMFTLQHYAVDAFAGVFVAIIAILVAKSAIKSKKQNESNISAFIQNDIISLAQIIRKLF